MSGSFWYPVDKFLHRVTVSLVDVPDRDVKKGDVLHLYGLPDALHPQGKVENMTRRYAKGLGPQLAGSPEFKVREGTLGSVIDGTTIDANGFAIVRWEWSNPDGKGWTWHCTPYFPFKG